MNINLPADWLRVLEKEFSKEYMKNIKKFLISEIES